MQIPDITAEKKEKQIQRLAAYCRVPNESDLAAEQKHFSDYVNEHPDLTLMGVYADIGRSGRRANNRPELNRMINDGKNGKIDRIVVKSVCKLTRNSIDLLQILRLFKTLEIPIIFEDQNIDTAVFNSDLITALTGLRVSGKPLKESKVNLTPNHLINAEGGYLR